MKEITSKLEGQAMTIVTSEKTAKVVKSGSLDVYATPMMVALMEQATCLACADILDEGETTVGIGINVSHDRASALGALITAKAVLENVDGRKLTFSVSAFDDNGNTIGKGTIERFVVVSDKFMEKVACV